MGDDQRASLSHESRWRGPLSHPIVVAAFFLVAGWLLWRQLRGISWSAFTGALLATSPSAILLSLFLTAISYACLSGTEWLALRALGHRLGYLDAVMVAVPAYAFTNSAGFSPATGTVFRVESYGRQGMRPRESAAVAMVAGAAVTLSGVVTMGLLILMQPARIGGLLHGSPGAAAAIGAALLVPAAFWFWAFTPQAPRWLGGARPPELRSSLRVLGLAAGIGDWLFSCAALFVLLPSPHLALFPAFLTACIAGSLISAATGVPGGLGVFEAVVLALTPMLSQTHETVAALLLYRCVYSLGPLTIWGLFAAARTVLRRQTGQ